jgi:hypothetical protein
MHGSIPPLPLVFMVWYLVKHKENFASYLFVIHNYRILHLSGLVLVPPLGILPTSRGGI